jgi:Cu+-exporting ATPase
LAVDPICGMHVPETEHALRVRRGNVDYYFCSAGCMRTFVAPEREMRLLRAYTAASLAVGAILLAMMFFADSLFAALGRAPPSSATMNLAMLVLATPIQFIAGARFYAGFWHAVRARAANMDTLIALGTTTAFGYSAVVALGRGRYGTDVYFDTSVLIIAFILLGKTLEHAMKDRATTSLRALVRLQPRAARRVEDGAERMVPVEELRVGDRFAVRPGERIPTDGRIVEGSAEIDEALVTGESVPVPRKVGDEVVGASLNTNGSIVVEARRVGQDTLLAQIQQLVEQAQAGRAPIQRLVDQISAKFVPLVILIAGLSAVLWYVYGGATPSRSLLVFVSVVIIACPCALGLATPAALLVGVGRAAENGLVVKDTGQFELAARTRKILFDKTGTLTQGRMEVTDVVPAHGPSREELLRVAASVEGPSEHPVASAIRRHAESEQVAPSKVADFEARAGRGVRATLGGHRVVAGTPAWLEENGVNIQGLIQDARRLESEAKTVLHVARGGTLLGLVALTDAPKPGAAEAIAALHRLGVETAIVSGDNQTTARAVADRLGIQSVHAPVAPAEKAALVAAEKNAGKIVAFVGDGINDAPAIAAADVGIALGGGTDVAREAGGLVLLRDDPRDVANLIVLARKTLGKIRQNLFWAFLYNVALIPVAALGLLDPILAGAAMGLSSVTVVGNSLTLRAFRAPLVSEGSMKRRRAPSQAKRSLAMAPAMRSDAAGTESDPVCHMKVDPATARFRHEHGGQTYYFCSAGCQKRFAASPGSFLGSGSGPRRTDPHPD